MPAYPLAFAGRVPGNPADRSQRPFMRGPVGGLGDRGPGADQAGPRHLRSGLECAGVSLDDLVKRLRIDPAPSDSQGASAPETGLQASGCNMRIDSTDAGPVRPPCSCSTESDIIATD